MLGSGYRVREGSLRDTNENNSPFFDSNNLPTNTLYKTSVSLF
jgi:hypothetical protein